jgi:hypothetical protein
VFIFLDCGSIVCATAAEHLVNLIMQASLPRLSPPSISLPVR